jgi:hypothetical protein
MRRNVANSGMIGIATFILFLVAYLASPGRGAISCPIPAGSLGTCTPVNSTTGKTTFTCSEATGVSCSTPLSSFPYVLIPLGMVVSAALALGYLRIGSKKGR